MTILRARILLTLAFVAVASARTCPLCPHGERPRNGNAVLFADGTDTVTCKEVEQDIFANADGSCDDFFTYAIQVVCRCPRVKAGSCPGICNTGYILDQPDLGTPFLGLTCSVVDQLLRGTPGVTNCDSEFANSGIKEFCICKVNVKPKNGVPRSG